MALAVRRRYDERVARLQEGRVPHSGWTVESGRLKHAASGGAPTATSGGDIITTQTFGDFDLSFEWTVAPGANSGVKYLVTEDRDGPIAHEYQIIDDVKHADAQIGPHRATAALYDAIAAPASKRLKPAGSSIKDAFSCRARTSSTG